MPLICSKAQGPVSDYLLTNTYEQNNLYPLELLYSSHDGDIVKVGKVENNHINGRFVMKVFNKKNSDEYFRNELKNLQKFNGNPTIIKYCGMGCVPKSILLPYAPMGDLFELIKYNFIDFSEDTCLYIIKCIAYALNVIHSFGLIHHDVKPENIVLMPNNIFVLIDFSFCGEPTTQGMGTPCYIAPEVISIDGVSHYHSDIYSLGAVLYTLLTKNMFVKMNKGYKLSYIIKRYKLGMKKYINDCKISLRMKKLLFSMLNIHAFCRITSNELIKILENKN